jgi:N-acetylmuramoyl-L-alanine amidase
LLLKKFIVVLIFALFFGGIPSYGEKASAQSQVTIGIDSLNVREGPGLSYRVVKQVNKGESFPLLKEDKDWIQVKLSNNQTGWVANWLVQKNTKLETKNTPTSKTQGSIIVDGLRVRNGPGLNFQTIGHLNSGLQVTIIEKNNNWTKISTTSLTGWVSSEFVTVKNGQAVDSTPAVKKGVVNVASLNVRSGASLQSSVVGKVLLGDKVEIIATEKDWIQINYLGKKAWISSQYVDFSSEVSNPPADKPTTAPTKSGLIGTVTANALNVRSKGDLTGSIVGSITKGSSFTIIEERNNWSKIEFSPGQFGWVNTWYLEKTMPTSDSKHTQEVEESLVTILYNGSNIRKEPNTQAAVVQRANEGEQFAVKSIKGEWYEILLKDGSSAYIAGWIVSVSGSAPQIEKPGADAHLKNKTIILDPGHGGGDSGTIGAKGTLEKELTLKTASLLYNKLRATGANVILTRTNDSYYSLRSRVSTAQYHRADAFISIHYDSIIDRSVRGLTTYYYHSFQKNLAESVHHSVVEKTKLKDRGARFGDYHVIRENTQNAILVELGYLSNPTEETIVLSADYQEMAANGIINGLAKFFKSEY